MKNQWQRLDELENFKRITTSVQVTNQTTIVMCKFLSNDCEILQNVHVFYTLCLRMRPKKMKEEEGARTIACPHKVGSLFMFMKLTWWCSTLRSLKTQLGYMKQENGCRFFRKKHSTLLCPP